MRPRLVDESQHDRIETLLQLGAHTILNHAFGRRRHCERSATLKTGVVGSACTGKRQVRIFDRRRPCETQNSNCRTTRDYSTDNVLSCVIRDAYRSVESRPQTIDNKIIYGRKQSLLAPVKGTKKWVTSCGHPERYNLIKYLERNFVTFYQKKQNKTSRPARRSARQ